MIKLYENIRQLRKMNGWSQDELAQRLGYTDRSSIAKIESGQVDLAESRIMAFAQVFGVKPSVLMGWEGPDSLAALPEKTQEYIDLYSSADPKVQDAVLTFLKSAKREF